ncbi:hypothetical protein M5K25_002458 [Dendrobium thyrsiflorum]|uniref:Uncharacterized protein n=1 Tax=Dendrobium thyrsiflorum TaxID=117978 RepID=A0ABD0VMD0_DENTH
MLSRRSLFAVQKFQNLVICHPSCMADPEHDHDFVFNDQELINILRSLFFNIDFENDQSVEDYVERILFSLASAIDQQHPPVQWRLTSES